MYLELGCSLSFLFCFIIWNFNVSIPIDTVQSCFFKGQFKYSIVDLTIIVFDFLLDEDPPLIIVSMHSSSVYIGIWNYLNFVQLIASYNVGKYIVGFRNSDDNDIL